MSTLAAKLDEIRRAAAIAKKLSPAMQKAMTAPTFALDVVGKPHVVEGENGVLALRNVRVGTVCALIDRGLANILQYDEGGMTKSNSFTELGLLVRDVLLRGADVVLEETRDAYWAGLSVNELNQQLVAVEEARKAKQISPALLTYTCRRVVEELHARALVENEARVYLSEAPCADAEDPSLLQAMPRRTVELHLVLARVADRQYRKSATSDSLYRHEVRPKSVVTRVVDEEMSRTHRFLDLGWVKVAFGPSLPTLILTDLGMKALMIWDGAYTRNDFPQVPVANVGTFVNPLAQGIPPREVIVQRPTKEVVRRFPEYYLQGPGRYIARDVMCEHDYQLTDSCPCC